jgi:glutathione S-transferase
VASLPSPRSRLDGHLRGRQFIAGERLTMGDIPVGVLCYRHHALGIARAPLGNLEAWYGRLTSREAFCRHVMLPLS